MKPFRFLHLIGCVLILVSSFALWSCKTKKALPTTVVQEVIKVETNTVVEYVTDTVRIKVPVESASNQTTEQSSHVETSLAESDAWIDDNGILNHNISNKPQSLPVAFDKPVERHDSIVYIEKPIPVEVPTPVERGFTKWERFRLDWFGVLALLTAGLLGWTFRKPLISLLRLIKLP